jgi:histidine triad (HIT) family protein
MKREDCIFCKIADGKIPCNKIYEDEKYIAILDIVPYVKGHTLVIPKIHSRWVWDINEKDYVEYMKITKKLAIVLKKAFDTQWVEEVIAGIGISHSHIHLFPRKENDGLGELPKKPLNPKPSEKEMKEIAEKIKIFSTIKSQEKK